MKILILFFHILILTQLLFSQTSSKLILVTEKKEINLPVFQREGTIYFSVKHFADALNINSYYNSDTEKLEVFFKTSALRFTAKNPFIVLKWKHKEEPEVYQIPTSTYLVKDDIFIPLIYTIDILKKASGFNLIFDSPSRLIVEEGEQEIFPDINIDEISTFNISGITVDEKANGTLIRIKSNIRIPSYNSSFKNGILKIIFRKVSVDPEMVRYKKETGLVKEISAHNINEDAEFTFRVSDQYSASEVLNADKGNDILVTIHNKVFTDNDLKEKNKERWNFNCIVIDAGHGGKDAGAIGVNGVKEKDINLGIALKLGNLIKENMKDVKVVYTRSNDTFVELYKRGKIANENDGKLFISIHCNSTPKKPSDANGFEVYLLRPGRTKEAIDIAEQENSVIKYEENPERYQQLTDENFILVSMAHSAYMKYSEKFAELLDKQFSNSTDIPSRGVKQAGFYVLVGASMPSVLIEAGFLSNKKDAEYLKSKNGQNKIAEAIFESIKKFKVHYENIVNSEL